MSVSKLRQTATRLPFGHDFGVSFRPTRATSIDVAHLTFRPLRPRLIGRLLLLGAARDDQDQ